MKRTLSITIIGSLTAFSSLACPVCEKQQPKITMGLTHGAGPASNWDWLIIGIMTLVTLLTLIYSIKYLIKPGEKQTSHIKYLFLKNDSHYAITKK